LAQEDDMIARIWRATASHEKAGSYQRHFAATVVPHLKSIAGFEGASLLWRKVDGGVELLALTLWESMDSIHAFAGADPGTAVVDPEAQAMLTTFDTTAHNYEVAFTDDRSRGGGLHP
jgi:heme-degrading monooxygenase HmoA